MREYLANLSRYTSPLSIDARPLLIKLFSIEECIWCSTLRNLHACGYHVPPSVEIFCFPYFLINDCMNCSATSILLSIEMRMPRIILSFGSVATHNHT